MNKNLILIDGSSYLFRAYHALPPLTTSQGVPTGAVYGVINMVKKLINTIPFDYIGVVFDPKGKTVRHHIFPAYKANRAAMPDELRVQIAPLFELIRAMGLPLIIQDGVEADDVIGTLAVYAQKQGIHTLISTMDKDMAQLVNDKVTLINTMHDKLYDINGVKEKFGVLPNQIIDYLALMGDTSDNIPGIPKVGPKTAALWLKKYGTVDNIIQHAGDITGKIGESLREHIHNITLSRQLVTIDCDVKLNLALSDLKMGNADAEALKKIFTQLQFTKWLREIQNNNSQSPSQSQSPSHYHAIQDEKSFDEFFARLMNAAEFSLDTETTNIDAMRAELVGMSFSVKAGKAVYIPFMHKISSTTPMEVEALATTNPQLSAAHMEAASAATANKQLNRTMILEKLTPLLQNQNKTIIGQNLKYDYKVLKNHGITITAPMQDTLLESYVLNSTSTRHDLDSLALKYLNKNTIKFEDVAGKGAKQITFDYVPIPVATQYAAEDADVTLQLHHVLLQKIHAENSYEKILTDIEWPLMPVLANMEFHGVLIDAAKLKKQSLELAERIDTLQKTAYKLVGNEFNLGSPKQLKEILFDKMKLPIIKKTPTGAPSTDEEVMQELALEFELPQVIVEYRQLSKLKSTYADALPEQINPKTGRVHTSYNQAVTSTGRLSSNNPNLQNIPIRSEEGRKIRQAFIAPTHHKIISADYSQIELRIMAHLSKDAGLLSAFEKKQDIHAATASEVFGVALNDVTMDMRRHAKAINFGLLYGMSAFGLAKQLGVDRNEAQKYMDTYFARYPDVLRYMNEARECAKQKGYVETLLGRRLFIPEINTSNQMRRKMAERAAINAPLQGTAADIIKLAMLSVNEKLRTVPAIMIMQVHDELIFEADKNHLPEICDVIKNCMENAFSLDVPLEIAIGVGDNWDEAH